MVGPSEDTIQDFYVETSNLGRTNYKGWINSMSNQEFLMNTGQWSGKYDIWFTNHVHISRDSLIELTTTVCVSSAG